MLRIYVEKLKVCPPWVQDIIYVVLALLFVWACAPLSIHLPFTPVPICFQANALLLCAVLLGSWRATITALLFVSLGALGVPIWASGSNGLDILVGPTGGYFAGYVLGSLVTGLIAEQGVVPTPARDFLAMLVSVFIIYLLGYAWLTQFVDPRLAFMKGVLPFIPGGCIKLILCAKLLQILPFRRYQAKEKL